MLLSHLIIENDNLPLLARLVKRRIDLGDSVYLNYRLSSEDYLYQGELADINLDSRPFKILGKEVPRLFLRWYNDNQAKAHTEWFRADTFDEKFELKPNGSGKWILTNHYVTEGLVDTEEPLLVTIIDQRLQAGDKVLINIEKKVKQFNGSFVTFKHEGILRGIAELAMRSPQLQQLANGDKGVSITYEKAGASKERGYRGYTELVLPVHSFDDLYTLEKGTGTNVWRLVNA